MTEEEFEHMEAKFKEEVRKFNDIEKTNEDVNEEAAKQETEHFKNKLKEREADLKMPNLNIEDRIKNLKNELSISIKNLKSYAESNINLQNALENEIKRREKLEIAFANSCEDVGSLKKDLASVTQAYANIEHLHNDCLAKNQELADNFIKQDFEIRKLNDEKAALLKSEEILSNLNKELKSTLEKERQCIKEKQK